MSQGFKPILDDCEFTYGAIDEASEGDDKEVFVSLETPSGDRERYETEAVGITEKAGKTLVLLFSWGEIDQEKIRELSEQAGIPETQVEHELAELGDDEMLVLERIVPYERVFDIRLSDVGLELFT